MPKSVHTREALAVVLATASAAVLYLIGRHGLGIEPEQASVDPDRVTIWSVLTTSAVAASFGWGLLGVLRRRSVRGPVLWTRIAVAVTLLSLLGPLTTPDLTASGRALLSLLHLVVGGVTIAVLRSAGESAAVPLRTTQDAAR